MCALLPHLLQGGLSLAIWRLQSQTFDSRRHPRVMCTCDKRQPGQRASVAGLQPFTSAPPPPTTTLDNIPSSPAFPTHILSKSPQLPKCSPGTRRRHHCSSPSTHRRPCRGTRHPPGTCCSRYWHRQTKPRRATAGRTPKMTTRERQAQSGETAPGTPWPAGLPAARFGGPRLRGIFLAYADPAPSLGQD